MLNSIDNYYPSQPNIIKRTSSGIQNTRIEDEMFVSRELFFTGDVNDDTCTSLIKQLMYLEKEDEDAPVKLYISSPGGVIDSGLALYDYLRMVKNPIQTICIGLAASMGAILFLAGDERLMLPHSNIMIHDPSFGPFDVKGIKALELNDKVKDLLRDREILTQIISDRTGIDIEMVKSMTATDTYLSAEESLREGIATGIIETNGNKGSVRIRKKAIEKEVTVIDDQDIRR